MDRDENFLSAVAEEFDVGGQCAVDFRDQWHALYEPFSRTFHFKLDHLADCGRIVAVAYHFFAHAEAAQIFERKINSSFGKVRAYVLPEVRELQCGAGVVGKQLALGIAVSAEVQYQMADRIRRISAVAE